MLGAEDCSCSSRKPVPAVPVRLTDVAVGVASTGVPVKVGDADKTVLPVPVDVVVPVPPLLTPSVPVTPVVSGRPVAFVSTPAEGVPRAGVTRLALVSVGAVDNTVLPEPVEVVVPVPPLLTPSVPVTPVASGRPVAFVKIPAEGVPRAGVTRLALVSVGAVESTVLPLPVDVVVPVPPLLTPSVPVTPVVSGRPVAFVRTPDAGVPSTGAVIVALLSVGAVSVLLLRV